MSMNEIRAMREKRVKLWEAAKAFVESRKDVSGTLSAEDSATYDQMEADVIRMGKEIERLERQEALDLEFDRPTARISPSRPKARLKRPAGLRIPIRPPSGALCATRLCRTRCSMLCRWAPIPRAAISCRTSTSIP